MGVTRWDLRIGPILDATVTMFTTMMPRGDARVGGAPDQDTRGRRMQLGSQPGAAWVVLMGVGFVGMILVVFLAGIPFSVGGGANVSTADAAWHPGASPVDDPGGTSIATDVSIVRAHGPDTFRDRSRNDSAVSEPAYLVPVPEPGDEYHEATAPDGSWISYVNPRDEYRSPYLGDGSAKICVTLLNEAGDPVSGESVPGTTVTIPTGETTHWHSLADPITVSLPLTEQYDRPYDADQFGTDPALPQGDGVLDAHCVEFHGLSSSSTVEYGEASVEGALAHRIELVGYIQQPGDAWDSTLDPVAAATPYDVAGGGWTFDPDASHGQVVVVFQLDGSNDTRPDGSMDHDNANNASDGEDTYPSNESKRAPQGRSESGETAAPNETSDPGATNDASVGRSDWSMWNLALVVGTITFVFVFVARRQH